MTVILKKLRRLGIGRIVSLLLLVSLLALRVWDPGPVEALRQKSFDIYQLMHPRTERKDLVSIIDIDEQSLRILGQWPWPRTVMAEMISKIVALGGEVIGFDVLFPEEDRSSPGVAAKTFQGLDDATMERLRRLPGNDAIFAEAIRNAKVVLGQSGYRVSGAALSARPASQAPIATLGPDPRAFLVDFPQLLRNLPILDDAAQGHGLFSISPEGDGTVRRVPVVAVANQTVVPSLSLEMLRVATGAGGILVKTDLSGVRSVSVQDFEIPTDGKGRIWIHFSAPDLSKYISAIDLLEGRVPADRIAGKMVLIGTSAAGLLDLKVTPVHPALPGVELHAQLLESALTRSTLSRPSYTAFAEILLAALLGLTVIGLAPTVSAGPLFVLGGLIAALILGMSWYCFSYLDLLIDYTFPLTSSFLVYAVLVCTNYMTVSADRRWIRSAFSQYISPDLVEQLAHSPERLKLGGEQRELTVLFSDIRGFTAISEAYKDDPQGLTALINRLFTPLTKDIVKHRGTIDKYMGDAIMAFWNAPLDDISHEAHACEAALTMQESLEILNEERRREADPTQWVAPLRIGIGLNTGVCVVGNFGSDLHFNYSVLGDTVNLASRLEGLTKQYGVSIIVGEKTAQAVRSRFAVLELDHLQVRGKQEPERIFALLGRADMASDPDFVGLLERNDAMLAAYRAREWSQALETILLGRETGKVFGLDDYHDFYIKRIRHQIEAPASSK
ncbi:adenylate/guanylate cyclase domain-containing protein [Microvirga sp. HBU67558]|uniref:CHASE2 domain-containing protein n=1 Tax=Microvirga TaxID=186650 RepID=UPI001B37302F|nr:adenylate/guanylate cyclase domain-containing protein [Microvirga sp. HBU67655]MBQ0824634.1 adenylate/guanylate cyclase domain-containing protein [Microvirga sp. HBU67558]